MTTVVPRDIKCALCGRTGKQMVVGSTTMLGKYPDLDTRPPELIRSTMRWWVQSCPACGYCHTDISQVINKAAEVVNTEPYQKQLKDGRYPKLADDFLCLALLHENNGEYREACWSCIHAAWSCDDTGSAQSSQECRLKALTFIEKMKGLGQKLTSQPGVEEALTVDLLRRSGQFALASSACAAALEQGFDGTIAGVLRLEQVLIGKQDSQCHSVSEISDTP